MTQHMQTELGLENTACLFGGESSVAHLNSTRMHVSRMFLLNPCIVKNLEINSQKYEREYPRDVSIKVDFSRC